MHPLKRHYRTLFLIVAATVFASLVAQADVVTDWNVKAGDIVVEARLGPPPANRVLAIVQSAVYEAVNAITGRYPPDRVKLDEALGASTVILVAPQWPQRKPWLMTSPAQFRPGPPTPLTSELWARDYNGIKALGGKHSMRRTAEQTEIARFWEATLPPIYHGIVRSVARMPGREVTQNARLFMVVTQATDDALIAVLDAKYHYNFWRPVTAIRNGDIDGNDATERDPGWTPFIDTPMHPEYPCAHCIVSATVGTVLQAEIGAGPIPTLTTTSSTAKGAARSWTTIDDFIQEVANARICDGVHYRTSTEVATAMGKQIGDLAVAKYLRPLP